MRTRARPGLADAHRGRVGLVAVGTELLSGVVVNGNAAWLGRVLTDAGVGVTRSAAVADDEAEIADAVTGELARAEAVVLTGGLGPTPDDRTRAALARLAGVTLRRDEALLAGLHDWYAARGRTPPLSALAQADVPEGATALPNPRGSAPGLRLDLPAGVVYALPGVPAEMRAMVDGQVLPDLLARTGSRASVTRTLRTAVVGESLVASLLEPLEQKAERLGVDVAYLASVGEVRVRLSANGTDTGDPQALLDEVVERARELLGDVIYGEDAQTLDVVVHRLLADAGETVAVAESLTGGLLGGALTDMPGSSETYRGGVTAYATDLKAALLGIDADLLRREGPVHPEVAAQMAAGVRARLDATVGVATTGVAGPDPQPDPRGQLVPPGTVHVAVSRVGSDLAGSEPGSGLGGADLVVSQRLGGERDVVRRRTVVLALDALRRSLAGLGPYREPESPA